MSVRQNFNQLVIFRIVMKKLIAIASSAALLASLVSGIALATERSNDADIYEDLAQMCEYYPQECNVSELGAGNGGGNEPPYTPRKPKKQQ